MLHLVRSRWHHFKGPSRAQSANQISHTTQGGGLVCFGERWGSRKTSRCGGEKWQRWREREGRKASLLLNLTFILDSVLYLTAQGHYAWTRLNCPRRLSQTVLHVNSLAAGAEVGVLSCHIKFQVNAPCQSCGAMQSVSASAQPASFG